MKGNKKLKLLLVATSSLVLLSGEAYAGGLKNNFSNNNVVFTSAFGKSETPKTPGSTTSSGGLSDSPQRRVVIPLLPPKLTTTQEGVLNDKQKGALETISKMFEKENNFTNADSNDLSLLNGHISNLLNTEDKKAVESRMMQRDNNNHIRHISSLTNKLIKRLEKQEEKEKIEKALEAFLGTQSQQNADQAAKLKSENERKAAVRTSITAEEVAGFDAIVAESKKLKSEREKAAVYQEVAYQAAAATKIQALVRGKQAREELKKVFDTLKLRDEIVRSYKNIKKEEKNARKIFGKSVTETMLLIDKIKSDLATVKAEEAAATKIQALVRGKQAREEIKRLKAAADQAASEKASARSIFEKSETTVRTSITAEEAAGFDAITEASKKLKSDSDNKAQQKLVSEEKFARQLISDQEAAGLESITKELASNIKSTLLKEKAAAAQAAVAQAAAAQAAVAQAAVAQAAVAQAAAAQAAADKTAAATKIQALVRGKQAREDLKRLKAEIAFAESKDKAQKSANNRINVAKNVAKNVDATITSRLNEFSFLSMGTPVGVASGDSSDIKLYGVWVQGTYGYSKKKADNTLSGYNGNFSGATIGSDVALDDNNILGFAYSNIHSNFKYRQDKAGDIITGKSHVFSLYNKYQLNDKFSFNSIFSAGFGDVKSKRNVNAKIADAKNKNRSYTVQTSANYTFTVNDKLHLVPSIGLKYAYDKDGSYKEYGAGEDNSVVGAMSNKRLSAEAGINIIMPQKLSEDMTIIPSIQASVETKIHNKNQRVKAKLVNMDNFFENSVNKNIQEEKISYNLGTGLVMKHRNIEFSTNYNFNAHKKYQNHQGSLRLKIAF